MEPITLCGAVIVAFGLWIELESLVKMLVKAACGSRMLIRMIALFSEPKPACANKYVAYTPRELRRQYT